MTEPTQPNIDKEIFEDVCRTIKYILKRELDLEWRKNLIASEVSYNTEHGKLRIVYEKKKDD